MEYVLNDGFQDSTVHNGRVAAVERLLRRLLALPRAPAVVLMQLPSRGQAFKRGEEGWRRFHVTPEDQYGALALYYDVPWLVGAAPDPVRGGRQLSGQQLIGRPLSRP